MFDIRRISLYSENKMRLKFTVRPSTCPVCFDGINFIRELFDLLCKMKIIIVDCQ